MLTNRNSKPFSYSAKEEAKYLLRPFIAHGLSKCNAQNADYIRSIGSERNYRSALGVFITYLRCNDLGRVRRVTYRTLVDYLEYRSTRVRQRSLDQDKRSLELVFQRRLPVFTSKIEPIDRSRAYTKDQTTLIASAQNKKDRFSTLIVAEVGLRAHELFTLALEAEQPRTAGRNWIRPAIFPEEEYCVYTVKGKNGLIRPVYFHNWLAELLEERRLQQPREVVDREINYLVRYDLSGGQQWSQSFQRAAMAALGADCSRGGHGLRHSFAQLVTKLLAEHGYAYNEALLVVSNLLGHFRPEITKRYLR